MIDKRNYQRQLVTLDPLKKIRRKEILKCLNKLLAEEREKGRT